MLEMNIHSALERQIHSMDTGYEKVFSRQSIGFIWITREHYLKLFPSATAVELCTVQQPR